MTREEAIQILSTRDAHGVLCGYTSGVTEAIDMAIEALQGEPVKYGKNISENGFLCSVCSFGDFGGFHGYEPNFCPNCGANMRAKAEPIKRYCKWFQMMCECATEWGYCKFTACTNQSASVKPSADVVEVVRCKDCKHSEGVKCSMYYTYAFNDEDYCSMGERK